MRPFVINGQTWRVIRVPAGDPRLIDRTGSEKLAVTDPADLAVYVNGNLVPPLLDKVMLHEVAHAVTVSWNLLPRLRSKVPPESWVDAEEWSAQLMENHALEVVQAAIRSLGRPVCVRDMCAELQADSGPW